MTDPGSPRRSRSARPSHLPLAPALALLLLVSCGREPAPPPASAATTLRIAHESDVLSLDPVVSSEVVTSSVLSNIYEGLVSFDKDMRLVPALAAGWSAADEDTWLIKLRGGVRFHDGSPLEAADVKAALERARTDPASGYKAQLSTVKDVAVVDSSTLRLRTLWPDPLLLNRLVYAFVVPRTWRPGPGARPVGTGPYEFVSWDPGHALEVKAFAGRWNGRPAVDRVRFVPMPEGERSVAALKQGQVDVLRWVPETLAHDLESAPGVRVESRTGLTPYFLWFNTLPSSPSGNPFSDRRVRQAVSLAIDRREIIQRLGGLGVPANQVVPKGVFGYVSELGELPFDPQRARRLLQEAGHADGFDTTLVHRPGASVEAVAGVVGTMLGEVGIRVKTETPDWGAVVAAWGEGRLSFFLAGWRFDDGDALSFLRDCLFTRDPRRAFGSFNPGYSSRRMDELIDENGRTFGESARLKHYETLMRFALDEMPLVPLYTRHNLYGVSNKVRWQPRLDGSLLAAEMSLE